MKAKLFCLILLVVGLSNIASAETPVSVGKYAVHSGRDLQYISANKTITVKNVVGDEGENSKILVKFNGGAALFYANMATAAQYDVYFTLKVEDDIIRIDCVYFNARSDMNGALVSKAVCGLNKKLDRDYVGTVSQFSDKWFSAVSKVNTRTILNRESSYVDISDAEWSGVDILRRYKSESDLTGNSPELLIKSTSGFYSFGAVSAYTIYQSPDLSAPAGLAIVPEINGAEFHVYTHDNIQQLLSDKGTLNR
jgi:hypothetical protein